MIKRKGYLFSTVVVFALLLVPGAATADGPSAITLGTPVSGTISTTGEIDWFTVTTTTLGDLTVTQTAWPPYIETRIAIFGPGNQTVPQNNPVYAASPGVYYIKVWSANDGTSADVYTFNAALATASTGNDRDNGVNASSAAISASIGSPVSETIGPSKETSGKQDEDWYVVTTEVVGDLTVTQTAWPPYIETRIAIFGPNDATVSQSNPVYAAAPGRYYIRVWSATDGSSIAVYTFGIALTMASTGNDIDKGANAASGAVPITIGTPVTDTIAPSKATAGKQDEDWFSLTITAPGELVVTQTVWPPYIETQIAVYGPDSSTTPYLKAAPAGKYFVKVWSANDGSSIAPYVFNTQFKPALSDGGSASGGFDASQAGAGGKGGATGGVGSGGTGSGATAVAGRAGSSDTNGYGGTFSVSSGSGASGGAAGKDSDDSSSKSSSSSLCACAIPGSPITDRTGFIVMCIALVFGMVRGRRRRLR